MKTRRPSRKISRIMRYNVHKMPNVNHHRCGAAMRQLFTDVYSSTCAVRNHANVMKDVKNDILESRVLASCTIPT